MAVSDLTTEALGDTAALIAATGARVLPVALDLRLQQSIEAALDRTRELLGAPDLLVNNAAFTLNRPAVEFGWEEWNAVTDVNLKGTYFMTTAFARQCIAAVRRALWSCSPPPMG